MSQILLASSNPGKIKELKHALAHLNVEIVPQSELNIASVDETGLSYVENAILKARHAASMTGLPCIADDSGLSVDVLQGAPGIYSARYAGNEANASDNIEKLLERLKDVPQKRRTASFHCLLVLMRSANDPLPIICHGEWSGLIIDDAQGEHGFGYDPIFYVPEKQCTAAQLTLDIKNTMSHRAKAIMQLTARLEEFAKND